MSSLIEPKYIAAVSATIDKPRPEPGLVSSSRRPRFTASFHRSDSGTNNVMSNVSNAGAAPTSMTQRHESRVM